MSKRVWIVRLDEAEFALVEAAVKRLERKYGPSVTCRALLERLRKIRVGPSVMDKV